MYTLQDHTKQKKVLVSQNDRGVYIALYHVHEPIPFYEGYMDAMLTFSCGKPWRSNFIGIDDACITFRDPALHISGNVGEMYVSLSLAFDDNNLLRWNVTWQNRQDQPLHDVAVGMEMQLPPMNNEKVTIPHMIYNNNPSADPEQPVPRLGTGMDNGFICEEHRLPIPCVNVEWQHDSKALYMSFFSIPSYVEKADGSVHYGSLGAYQTEQIRIAAMSGVLTFNGQKDVCYVHKAVTKSYSGGYLDFAPGFEWHKEYVLDWGQVAQSGWGFRKIVRQAYRIFCPSVLAPLTIDEIIDYKTSAMDDRWTTNDGAAGYVKFNDTNDFGKVNKAPLHFLYGWTGQCLKLAWCDALLGFTTENNERIVKSKQAVDFYVHGSSTSVPGLRHSSYMLDEQEWGNFMMSSTKQPVVSSRAYGETITDLANIILLYRQYDTNVPQIWIDTVQEAADFFITHTLSSGIFPAAWLLNGEAADDRITAAGIPCLIASTKAYCLSGETKYLDHAQRCMQRYYDLHARKFDRPFAHSTLDAASEDKEAGMYYFIAAYELYKLTKKETYKQWAQVAADWLLTFVYVWNPTYDRGGLFHQHAFAATGWPGVSVQNHHLDVFFPVYELWHFARLTDMAFYERTALSILQAMGQGISTKRGEWGFTVRGEQAEGFFQTNWQQRGYSNTWNPSWVIALMLSNALRIRHSKVCDSFTETNTTV